MTNRWVLLLFFLTLPVGAGVLTLYPVKPAREYRNVVEKSGLVIAAVPLEDSRDQRTYLGLDVRSKGYVPIFLVMENQTSADSFLFNKEDIRWFGSSTGSTLPNPANPSRTDKALGVVAAIPTALTLWASIETARSKVHRQDLLRMELQSATLSPGSSASGFIFVPEKRSYSSRQTVHLVVPFVNPKTDQVLTIDSTI
jgi:hypothetical protein